jgi:hypothetical protein
VNARHATKPIPLTTDLLERIDQLYEIGGRPIELGYELISPQR